MSARAPRHPRGARASAWLDPSRRSALVEALIRVGVINRFVVPLPSRGARRDSAHRRRGERAASLLADRAGSAVGEPAARASSASPLGVVLYRFRLLRARVRDLGRRARRRADRAHVSAVPGDLRPQRDDDRDDRLRRGPRAGDPQDRSRAWPARARCCSTSAAASGSRRAQQFRKILLPAALPTIFVGLAARADLRDDQHRRRRVPDQLRRPGAAHQRARRALRPAGHVRRDPVRRAGERRCSSTSPSASSDGCGRSDDSRTAQRERRGAARGRRGCASARSSRSSCCVARLGGAGALGLLFRDVVPSLGAIGHGDGASARERGFYGNLGVTAGEVGVALAIGGARRTRGRASCSAPTVSSRAPTRRCVYYLGPTPKIIFFPVMIMWFGVGRGIQDRDGRGVVLLSGRDQRRRRHARRSTPC